MADEQDVRDALSGAKDLASFDLRSADLSGHDFTGCNLENTRLDNANLSGANISQCDLTQTKYTHVNLTEANCSGSKFKGAIFGVNFSKSNLNNSDFSNSSLFTKCNFDGADLRGADFSNSRLSDENTFTDAIYDEKTEFERVEILRPQSKNDVFKYFSFSRGKLHRSKERVNSQESPEIKHSPTPAGVTPSNETDVKMIGGRLAKNTNFYAIESDNLAGLIKVQINWWESKKPNQNDDEWRSHYNFLKSTHTHFVALTEQIKNLNNQPTQENQTNAGEQALTVQKHLSRWLSDFGTAVGKSGDAAALLSMIVGASVGLTQLIGSNPTVTLTLVAAALGGEKLASVVKSLKTTKSEPLE